MNSIGIDLQNCNAKFTIAQICGAVFSDWFFAKYLVEKEN